MLKNLILYFLKPSNFAILFLNSHKSKKRLTIQEKNKFCDMNLFFFFFSLYFTFIWCYDRLIKHFYIKNQF